MANKSAKQLQADMIRKTARVAKLSKELSDEKSLLLEVKKQVFDAKKKEAEAAKAKPKAAVKKKAAPKKKAAK